MKKLILFIAIVFSSILAHGQIYTFNNGIITNVNEQDINYLEVTGYFNIRGSELKSFYLDYGQVNTETSQDNITNKQGRQIKLKSMGAILNYLDKNSWMFIHAYSVSNSSPLAQRYIFKRKSD